MADLSTSFLGMTLRSPIIVGSSSLTGTAKGVALAERHGAGAVVLKSVYEEQILFDAEREASKGGVVYGQESIEDYVAYYERKHTVDSFIRTIRESKEQTSIPIIASVNAISTREWQAFCAELADAGADAIQLNLFVPALTRGRDPRAIEETYLEIVRTVKETANLPVAVKIGPYFTNVASLIEGLQEAGADAAVLFNRFYAPDFDIDTMTIGVAAHKSHPEEFALPLRFVALLSGEASIPLVGATGIHDGETVVKLLLAGAHAVEVVSALYEHKVAYLERMNAAIAAWMDRRSYASIDAFRGLMSREAYSNPEALERVQYMQHYGDVE